MHHDRWIEALPLEIIEPLLDGVLVFAPIAATTMTIETTPRSAPMRRGTEYSLYSDLRGSCSKGGR